MNTNTNPNAADVNAVEPDPFTPEEWGEIGLFLASQPRAQTFMDESKIFPKNEKRSAIGG